MNLVPNILGSLAVAAALLFARVRADDEVTLRLKGKGFSYSWGLSNYEFDLFFALPCPFLPSNLRPVRVPLCRWILTRRCMFPFVDEIRYVVTRHHNLGRDT